MKYISIDIETSGLDPKTCQILEFAAVVGDTEARTPAIDCPSFSKIIRKLDGSVSGEPYALNMNRRIIEHLALSSADTDCYDTQLYSQFLGFALSHGVNPGRVAFAGKNFTTFDLYFLKELKFECFVNRKGPLRCFDPGAMFSLPGDEKIPNLTECKKRAGLVDSVSHVALDDARDVVELLNVFFGRIDADSHRSGRLPESKSREVVGSSEDIVPQALPAVHISGAADHLIIRDGRQPGTTND